MAMVWIELNSSQLVRIGHDAETLKAQVQFKDRRTGGVSATYEYDNVPREVVDDIASAGSAGQQFNETLKYGFSYRKL